MARAGVAPGLERRSRTPGAWLAAFVNVMSDHIYFSGDPAQDSARRHLERVLSQPQRRRWPFLAALFAGGTALTLWGFRNRRRATPAAQGTDSKRATDRKP